VKHARLVVGLLALAACTRAPATPEGLRVGLITPGSVTDAAWNSGAYHGLVAIHDSLGVPVSHVEARTPAAQEEALRAYAAQGYGLVFAHGYEFQDAAERVSAEYPRTIFIVTSGARTAHRVAPLIFRLEEASYLAGRVAGRLTKSNVIGFVGGVELPPVKAAYEGWVNGAMSVNPKVQSRSTYLNNWDDAALGREAALALIRVKVDVFHHNADAAALGVFQAAKETPGVLVFGANADQSALAPAQVPGSAVIDLPRAFLTIAREVQKGHFAPRVIVFGLEGGVVRYEPNPAFSGAMPLDLGAQLQAARDSIIAGTLRPAERPKQMRAASGRRTDAGG
jgi:basic membrane lipoprotein Med (substrate-binding protein (PBP1-ABC) superfamily)